MTAVLDHTLHYAARGWRVVPIPPGLKYPGIDAWQDKATSDETRIRAWWTNHPTDGVGIATGPGSGIFVVDVDNHDGGANGADTLADLEAEHGELPDTVEAITGSGGRHLYFKLPPGVDIRNNAGKRLGPGLDIRGDGGQVLAPPTIHPNGQPYVWEVEHDPLDGQAVATAPQWLVDLLIAPPATLQPRREPSPRPDGAPTPGDIFAAHTSWPELLEHDGWHLHSQRLDHRTQTAYELWTRPGKTVHDGASASLYYGGTDVLNVFTTNPPPGLASGDTYTKFGYLAATRFQGSHSAAAADLAAAQRTIAMPGQSPIILRPLDPASTTPPPASDDTGMDEPPGQQPYTPLGNARRLVASHGHDLRWAPQWGTWLTWDGHRWAEDITGEATRRAKAVVDSMFTELATMPGEEGRKKLFAHWMRSQSAPQIESMTSLARTEPGMPVTVAELDADPWILNTRGGAIDLRTGAVSGAERRHLVTKLAPVLVDPTATCPAWEAFIHWAMQGNLELIEFLQRAVGYTLTGTVGEQCLFFLHGAGANGKSTFLNLLQRLMGDYSIAAEADLLLATNNERHSTGIADLVGRRLVIVQETDEGRRFAEATVKQLTGGDTVRARRMRQDNFEFRPTHKLWMAANHRPVVRGTDHAIWRRIKLIPFDAIVGDDERDDNLLDKLVAELPGILNWALTGAALWRTDGLKAPAAVIQATQQYRTEQDHVGRFLEECCTIAEGLTISASDLRRAYETWCTESGERPWSAKAMAPHLVERGASQQRGSNGGPRMWRGVALAGEAAEELSRRLSYGDWQSRASGDTRQDASHASLSVDNPSFSDAVTLSDASPVSRIARTPDPVFTDKASLTSLRVTDPEFEEITPDDLFG